MTRGFENQRFERAGSDDPTHRGRHRDHDIIARGDFRLFADAEWLYAFNGERFIREASMYAVFDQLDVDDAAHAFYLGKELMKATIARGLARLAARYATSINRANCWSEPSQVNEPCPAASAG